MAKLLPIEQKMVDTTDGNVVVLTRVKATSVNDNWITLPSAAQDAKILYATGQTSLVTGAFYLGQNVIGGGGFAKQNISNVVNIDGTTAGTEFLIASRHANFKNTSLT